MSIDHVIETLRFANIAFLLGKITRDEAKHAHYQAMCDYQVWSYRVSDQLKTRVEILSSALLKAMAE